MRFVYTFMFNRTRTAILTANLKFRVVIQDGDCRCSLGVNFCVCVGNSRTGQMDCYVGPGNVMTIV